MYYLTQNENKQRCVTPEGAADLLAAIPHAKYADVAGTGHMVAGDDNSVFLARVAEFLDSDVSDSAVS